MGSCSSNNNQPKGSQKTINVRGLKIAVVGDKGVGKTSILSRYVHNQFSPIYIPTTKVAIENLVRKLNVPSHATVPLTLWDIPGQEDLPLHQSYFRNLDAVIVCVDASDLDSLESAKLWREAVLSNASFLHVDTEPGVVEEDTRRSVEDIPFLLLGNKSDLIQLDNNEHLIISELSPAIENKEKSTDFNSALVAKALGEIERQGYVGSVLVSAKGNNLSVHTAIQNFLRKILEKDHHINKKWRASTRVKKEKKQRYEFKPSMKTTGINQIDAVCETADSLIHRVQSLARYQKDCFDKFAEMCVEIGIIPSTKEASLQNCLVALRDKMMTLNLKLKLKLKDEFYSLEVQASSDGAELETSVRYTIKTFNKEYGAVTETMLSEFPLAQDKLAQMDAHVARLCEEHQIPVPGEAGGVEVGMVSADLKKASEAVEQNRAMIRHVSHECHDNLAITTRSVKQAKAAFVW